MHWNAIEVMAVERHAERCKTIESLRALRAANEGVGNRLGTANGAADPGWARPARPLSLRWRRERPDRRTTGSCILAWLGRWVASRRGDATRRRRRRQ